eukprot:364877-Chlamydomonas_euryale.AAC.11
MACSDEKSSRASSAQPATQPATRPGDGAAVRGTPTHELAQTAAPDDAGSAEQAAAHAADGAPGSERRASQLEDAEIVKDADIDAVEFERLRAEEARRLLLERLRSIREGVWDTPAYSDEASAVGGDAGQAASGEADVAVGGDAGGAAGGGGSDSLVVRSPWMTWLLVAATAATFTAQWAPLLPRVLSSASCGEWGPLMAFALAVPPTPAADSWQTVRRTRSRDKQLLYRMAAGERGNLGK